MEIREQKTVDLQSVMKEHDEEYTPPVYTRRWTRRGATPYTLLIHYSPISKHSRAYVRERAPGMELMDS